MKYLIVFYGNYGAGKTFMAKQITNNIVAFASPIRKVAFKIFKDDRVYSTQQSDKDAVIDTKNVPKPKGVTQKFHDRLLETIDDFPKTIRGVLQAIGGVGRYISKDYWAKEASETIEGLFQTQDVVCVDDLRYVNELKVLKKIKGVELILIEVSDSNPLEGYELDKLSKLPHITLNNSLKEEKVSLETNELRVRLGNLKNYLKRSIIAITEIDRDLSSTPI